MNMTREDMMRELELLPVWQLKQPQPTMPLMSKLAPLAVEPSALQQDTITETTLVTAQPDVVEVEMPQAAQPATMPAPLAVAAEIIASPEPVAETISVTPKIATPWLLYCPLASAHTEVHTLLHNMVKAMRLLSTDVVVLTDIDKIDQYEANTCVLFGLTAAQHYLNGQADNIEALRGKPHQQQGACWVTYHPEDLLQNPALKRGAWQDLCAALAHHAA